MCNRTTTFSLLLVLLISCIPVMAFGPTNSRLLGFSGAGVAVVPLEGQTAISINPAAPGFMKQRQINFNLDYGTGERATHWFRVDEYGNTDSRGLGAGAEFYFPLGPLNLFFGLGSEFETVESEGTTWHHTYHPVDDKLSSTSTKPHLGLACSFSDVVSVGGQLLYWHNDSTYELADDFEFEFDARLLTGELGVLVTTPINLNFGLTWSTEDGKADRDEIWVGQASYAHECFYGMPSTLRIGAVDPPHRGRLPEESRLLAGRRRICDRGRS